MRGCTQKQPDDFYSRKRHHGSPDQAGDDGDWLPPRSAIRPFDVPERITFHPCKCLCGFEKYG
jgi:hypothetical protein